MAAVVYGGPLDWSLERDDEGYRIYSLSLLIYCTATTDGPLTALYAPGTPQPGDSWNVDGNVDASCYCLPRVKVKRHEAKDGDPHEWYRIDYTFTNKPLPPNVNRCTDTPTDNPLLEPVKKSGGFSKYTEEGLVDRFGKAIMTSSHELFRGPQNEWDHNRPTVKIKQNVLNLDLGIWSAFIDCVNDRPLWGAAARCVKLSNVSWEILYYGRCIQYVSREFEFEINAKTWDRDLLDESNSVLNGKWDSDGTWKVLPVGRDEFGVPIKADPNNPSHFIRATGRDGNARKNILNGKGVPYDPEPLPYTEYCGGEKTSLTFNVVGLAPTGETESVEYTEDGGSNLCTWSGSSLGGADSLSPSSPSAGTGSSTPYEYRLFYDSVIEYWIFKRRKSTGSLMPKYDDTLGASGTIPYQMVPLGSGEGIWYCKADKFKGYIAGHINVFTATPATATPTSGISLGPGLQSTVRLVVPLLDSPGYRHVEKYPSVNMLLLGIPSTL